MLFSCGVGTSNNWEGSLGAMRTGLTQSNNRSNNDVQWSIWFEMLTAEHGTEDILKY